MKTEIYKTKYGDMVYKSGFKPRLVAGYVGELCELIILSFDELHALKTKLPCDGFEREAIKKAIFDKIGVEYKARTTAKPDTTKPKYDMVEIKARLQDSFNAMVKSGQKHKSVVTSLNVAIDYMFIGDSDKTVLKSYVGELK